MTPIRLRNASRRLVGELVLVTILAGFPIHFPRSVPAQQSWTFLVTHPTLLLHVLVGTLLVVEAGRVLARGRLWAGTFGLWIGALGAASIATSFIAGLAYTLDGQTRGALNLMSLGDLTAFGTYLTGWILAHKRVRAATDPKA